MALFSPTGFLTWLTAFFLCVGCGERPRPPAHTNHLADESSPYLLDHAHNPVDWHPWGEEALDKAAAADKMLLISIGYASCHWCHVMERESFSDSTVAARMNRHFVPIKVDREERPDIDQIYMTACQLASDRGCGWPLNVVALPDGRPVWAGTYYPRKAWLDVLEYFIRLRQDEPIKLEDYADRLSEGVSVASLPAPEDSSRTDVPHHVADSLAQGLLRTVDLEQGGRSGSPKFPMPAIWSFLLQYQAFTGADAVWPAIAATLDGMARGGIYDLLGGGFARYATDTAWHIPHFEKMLYDNAQLVSLYADAYRYSGEERYAGIVEETLAFIERELTDPEGGFYASLDADSEGEEGAFYIWTQAEIEAALHDPLQSRLVRTLYGISPQGNWEAGKNILRRRMGVAELARREGMEVETVEAELQQAHERLFAARSKRARPRRDDKRLTAWNAMMLSAYLRAYHALGREAYLEAALRNAGFIRQRLQDRDGPLLRTFPTGKREVPGFLEDYAFTARAFLDLYQATFDPVWLERVEALLAYADTHFFDPAYGLYQFSSKRQAVPVSRQLPIEDNVMPSANAVLADVLLELSHIVYEPTYRERGEGMLQRMGDDIATASDGAFVAHWGQVLLDALYPPYEVAIVGPQHEALRQELMRSYLPQAVLLGGAAEGELELLQRKLVPGKTLIYVCRDRVCKRPVERVEEALAQLRSGLPATLGFSWSEAESEVRWVGLPSDLAEPLPMVGQIAEVGEGRTARAW